MGKSSLVILCCAHLLLLENALAQSSTGSIVIYGLEQGSNLKIPKYSTDKFLLQVASFEKHANTVIFKNKLAKLIDSPVYIEPVKRVPITYRVIIGPIANAASVVNISQQLLAQAKPTQANSKLIIKRPAPQLAPLTLNNKKSISKQPARQSEKTRGKTFTIYGLEQGSHLKIPKFAKHNYRLQLASFDKYEHAETYKKQLAHQIAKPIEIVASTGNPKVYRVVIGPIDNASSVVNLCSKMLAEKNHSKNKSTKPSSSKSQTLTETSHQKEKREEFSNKPFTGKTILAAIPPLSDFKLNKTLSDTQQFTYHSEAKKALSSLMPDDQSIYQSSLNRTANNIEAALKKTKLKTNQVQLSSLPNLYTGSLVTTYSENSKQENNWQKNLFLALAVLQQRTEAELTRVGKSPDNTKVLPLDKTREDNLSQQPLSISNYLTSPDRNDSSKEQKDEKESRMALADRKNQPLIQLAESSTEMVLPLNMPSITDMQAVDEKITYVSEGKEIHIALKNYDPKVFLLAYNVFVMNGSIGYAYRIAYSAVNFDPKSVPWRERLAEAALWAGNAEVALEQWMYLINNRINPGKYTSRALILAGQIGNYDSQLQVYQYLLQLSPQNKDLLISYNLAMQKRGYPGKAAKMLLNLPNAESDRQILEQLIFISKGTDEPEKQLHYLQKLSTLDPKDIKAKLEQAKLFYSRGELAAAYQIFVDTAANAGLKNTGFWDHFAQIALLTGHSQTAIYALKNLFNLNAINLSSVLQLIQLEQNAGQTLTAYRDARKAYRKNPDISIVQLILTLGTDLNKWQEIKYFIDSLSTLNFNKLNALPEYAILIAQTNRRAGYVLEAFENWSRILRLWPQLSLVQESYLWYLIDNHEFRQMKYILGRWCNVFALKPQLWEVYSAALSDIGNNFRALAVAKPHYEEINKDYAKLLATADLFNQANQSNTANQNDNFFTAHYLKRRALNLLLKEIAPHPENLSMRQSLAYSEIVRSFGPAAMIYNVILKISKDLFKQPEVDDQIVAWALENRNYALARYIIRAHKLTGRFTPPWMSLTLALEENDRDMMQFLLLDSPDLLPYRDRVTAAVRSGNQTRAETYAFKGLKEHPFDAEMYALFEETMLPRANKFSTSVAAEGWGVVQGPLTKISARYFLTPSISVTPYGIVWVPRVKAKYSDVFRTTPSVDEKVGVITRQYVDNGWREIDIGERKSLAQFYPVIAKWHRDNIIARLDGELSLGYHDRADETTSLLLGGMKNEIKLDLEYDSKSYNRYELGASVMEFLGQDKFHLGSGQEYRFHWQHKFYLSYPDWNFNFYGNVLNYHTKNRIVTPLLQRLIPIEQDPTASFYVPLNDVNGIITLGFGQQYKDDYTHKWKPFAEGGLIFSKLLGFGQTIEGGIATSIFGRDHLVLFAQYNKNQQQVNEVQQQQQQANNRPQDSQVFYNIGISYDYYF
ncbi:MAG: tetratricopeptide repeat protein [Tatlockia sp.]|nr:tetratricopeptide repeat protein [Tatlockia sp.]